MTYLMKLTNGILTTLLDIALLIHVPELAVSKSQIRVPELIIFTLSIHVRKLVIIIIMFRH